MRNSIEEWVDKNIKVVRKNGPEWYCLCPIHDDKEQSMQINVEKGVANCHRCGGMHVSQLARRMGITGPETRKEVARYDYQNEHGVLIYQVVRFESGAGRSKSFAQWDAMGKRWGMSGVERFPYRLPKILEALKSNKPILVVEGEKDADTLERKGFCATTNSGGAQNKNWSKFVKYFPSNARMFIIPDYDQPGMKHAKKVGSLLIANGCTVKLVDLGYMVTENHGKDITDWFETHTKEEFIELCKNAKSMSVVEADDEDDLLEKDYGHARCLDGFFRRHYRWAEHKQTWMVYTGKYWKETTEEKVLLRSSKYLRKEYKRRLKENTDYLNNSFYKNGMRDTNIIAKIKSCLPFLKGMEEISISGEEWNKNKWHLNCQNGTLDLQTLELKAHNPDDLITKVANVDYNKYATDGAWNAHLEYFIPNENVRRELQRNLGIGICGALLAEILPIWYGTGGNGKTTTSNIMRRILGGYVRSAPANVLMRKRNEEHPEAIADLAGSRLVFCEEITVGQKLAEGVVKSLTGGGFKRSRHLYGKRFDFEQTFNIYLLVNDRPRIEGTDFGIWRRVRLIPWETVVESEKQIPQEEILTRLEGDGSAILNWLITGLKDFQTDTKWIAPEVVAATNDYKAGENSAVGFIMRDCELNPFFCIKKGDLYDHYTKYCEEQSVEAIGKRDFGKLLLDHYKVRDKRGTAGAKTWTGIKVKDQISGDNIVFNNNNIDNSDFSDLKEGIPKSIQETPVLNTFLKHPEKVTKVTNEEEVLKEVFDTDETKPDIY